MDDEAKNTFTQHFQAHVSESFNESNDIFFFHIYNMLYNILYMPLKKPKQQFKTKTKERIDYRTVSYRLPAKLLERLDKHVDSENSACSLVTQMMEWALVDLERQKR